jgi:cell division protein FtsW (lipid II flippase)
MFLSLGVLGVTTVALVGLVEGARTGASRWIAAGLLLICAAYFVALGLVCAWAKDRQPRDHAVGLGRHSRNPSE